MNTAERTASSPTPLPHAGKHTVAFTLIELMVVLAVITLLAATLLPALTALNVRTQLAACTDNQRQMALGWQMYADDNNGTMMRMSDNATNCWRIRPDNLQIPGRDGSSWPPVTSNTDANMKYDQFGYRVAALYRYAQNDRIIHCPADYRFNQPAPFTGYTSYSGLGGLGDFTSTSELLHPAERFLWTEENNPRAITVNGKTLGENLGTWIFEGDPTPPDWQGITWYDGPAAFHITGAVFSYADGHVAIRRWQDDATLALAVYAQMWNSGDEGTLTKAALGRQITLTSSPTGPPLYTDGLGSPHDLPFFASGYATSLNP